MTVLASLIAAANANAAEYYVAPTGSDSNPGTMASPFATLARGHMAAAAGDTVFIRGGTYSIVGQGASSAAGIAITKSGTSATNRIKFWAYNGEVPVFDFARLTISTTGYTVGFSVTGSWLHFKGLEIKNVPMNTRSNTGMSVGDCSNNIFELMNFHHNNGSGFFISHGTGGHLVLNSDSHDNYDPTSSQGAGQNADGFGIHYQETGPPTVLRGCRAWWNSDDGYDLISQEVPVTIENSWAMGNGYINSGTERPGSGNGNGFKAGSSKTGIRHIIRGCLAWKNPAAGFYANHSSGGNDWFNNTSYNNGTQYNMLASIFNADDTRVDGVILTGAARHKMRNNIGFPNKNSNMEGVDTMFNTWDLNIVPATGDFTSVTDTGFMGPRQADGSMPAIDFMKLRAGSPHIDKGTNVNLPFVGAAPDLGAFEYGATPTTGTGGGGGNAGIGGGTQPGTGGMASGGRGTGGTGAGGRGTGGTNGGGNGSGGNGSGGSGSGGDGSGGAGAPGSGGVPGSGGAIVVIGTGGGGGGGPTGSGGATAGGGSSGSTGGQTGSGVDGAPAGCACAIDANSSEPVPMGYVLAMAGALAVLARRRRTRPTVS